MKLAFKKSFSRDLKKQKTDHSLLEKVRQILEEAEQAENIHGIKNLKKLKAKGSYYRIRIGNFRLGIVIKDDTICFVRCLHRSEVYRFFP